MDSPPEDLGIAASFRSPELLFDNIVDVGCDLWALACTVYEIRTGSPLFENFMDDDDEIIMQMVPLLGKLPESWWKSWEARGRLFEEDGAPLVNLETGRSFVLMDTLEQLISGKSPCKEDVGRKKNGAGGFLVQIEEGKVLADLLRGLLKYDSKERLSVDAALEHPWFSTPWSENF